MSEALQRESLTAQPRRPLVRYHGGKWKLAPWIIEHMPPHHTYVEPFGGGGSVLLRKPRSYAEVYNDLDGEIVNVFRMARDRGEELRRALELTPFARDEFLGSYQASRDPLEQARRTILRSFQGFGSAAACGEVSGFRANSSRSGTTPALDWRNYPAAFGAIVERLRGVVIENRDARAVMTQHDSERALHYVDPPYVHAARSTKMRRKVNGEEADSRKAYKHELTDDEHIDLLQFLDQLQGMVVLSGYPSELYASRCTGWTLVERVAHADGARPRVECLWLNPACVAALDHPRQDCLIGDAA